MSRKIITLPAYTPGANTAITIDGFLQPAKDNVDLLALGCFARNQGVGGSQMQGHAVGSGVGWLNAVDGIEFEIDNTSSQITGTASVLICRVRVKVRVENVAMSFTPKIWNLTDSSFPTQSGFFACSAISPAFSGTHQSQTIAFTPAAGKKLYILQGQKSADTYQAWLAKATLDLYIEG